ncbi:MAG: hypothetical protein OEM28_01000 [Nitrosopumilus sp.]|nr:hypothetical protein [Nitrosopumilus sp.]MDH3486442.1 hypothetical protein [Nitrosopumilus sp.]
MDITEGKSKSHHIGKKTREVLLQELNSHKQNKQETFSLHEDAQWKKKLAELGKELSEL